MSPVDWEAFATPTKEAADEFAADDEEHAEMLVWRRLALNRRMAELHVRAFDHFVRSRAGKDGNAEAYMGILKYLGG